MSTLTMSDWLMFRPLLTLAFMSIVVIAARVAIAIRKLWNAMRAKRRAAGTTMASDKLPNVVATPDMRSRPSTREAANDSRPRAA